MIPSLSNYCPSSPVRIKSKLTQSRSPVFLIRVVDKAADLFNACLLAG